MSPKPPEDKQFEAQYDYAWNWFVYHAGQRLTGVNFFLILAAASVVAYSNAVKDHSPALGMGVAGFGALVAAIFFALDVRNKQLVDAGVTELKRLEADLGMTIIGDDDTGRGRVANHSITLRSLLGGFALLGVAAMIWASHDFGRDEPRQGSSTSPRTTTTTTVVP